MKYTIDDLRGKYVKVGTPECYEFLKACVELGIRWADGESARNKHQDKECISLGHHAGFLSFSDLSYYRHFYGWSLFVPKTTSVDWSKAPKEATHALRYVDGDIDFAVLVGDRYQTVDTLGGYFIVADKQWQVIEARPVTDEIDDTVTQRGERYGLFADGAKYERTLVGLCGTHVKTDVYRVLDAFNTGDPILDHLIKKALCAGLRGHKDKLTDYRNIVESAEKALKLLEQKQNGK